MISKSIKILREEGLAGVRKRILWRLAGAEPPPAPKFWSEYLDWLTFANSGMLARGNVWSMDYAVRNLPSEAPIVEIGSFCGLSTNVITYLKERNKKKNRLVTCDRWEFEGAATGAMLGDSQSVSQADYKQFVKGTFLRNVQLFSRSDLPQTIELFSDEFFSQWAAAAEMQDVFGRPIKLGGPISFCYIDGNHTYDFAKRDFENCDQFLEKGGFVLFDDSGDGSGWEVCRVVQEVIKTNRYELIAKNPNYFFRKKSTRD